MYAPLRPEDFGRLHDPEYRKSRGLPIEGEVIESAPSVPALSPSSVDHTQLLRAMVDEMRSMNARLSRLENSSTYGLPGEVVVERLRTSQVQVNALAFDED